MLGGKITHFGGALEVGPSNPAGDLGSTYNQPHFLWGQGRVWGKKNTFWGALEVGPSNPARGSGGSTVSSPSGVWGEIKVGAF